MEKLNKLNVRNEYQCLPIDKIKEIQTRLSMDVTILLFNIRTDGNIGMIIRQACLSGCKKVIICGRKHYDKRFTVGAHNYIETEHWHEPMNVNISTVSPGVYKEIISYDYNSFINKCTDYTIIFIEQGGMDIREVKWKLIKNPLIVVGNESMGIPRKFIKLVKKKKPDTQCISIPQYSVMRSINVAVATSIILWEIGKTLNVQTF
jgi:tRNA G18 (ribose-2'-O)-methylase SpoU